MCNSKFRSIFSTCVSLNTEHNCLREMMSLHPSLHQICRHCFRGEKSVHEQTDESAELKNLHMWKWSLQWFVQAAACSFFCFLNTQSLHICHFEAIILSSYSKKVCVQEWRVCPLALLASDATSSSLSAQHECSRANMKKVSWGRFLTALAASWAFYVSGDFHPAAE